MTDTTLILLSDNRHLRFTRNDDLVIRNGKRSRKVTFDIKVVQQVPFATPLVLEQLRFTDEVEALAFVNERKGA